MNTNHQPQEATGLEATCDRAGYDQPYRFGRTPRASAPYPFSTREFARLLVLRGRIRGGQFAADDLAAS
jgi:hypothetical protein